MLERLLENPNKAFHKMDMDKWEQALNNALIKNEEEQERWKKYEKEHRETSENLKTFSQKLGIDVMVPIGSKAFMTGKLIHTNEILISHFGKMFSKCTVHQAQEICKHRVNIAEEYLQKLSVEKDMFQNNLEVPYKDGAIPNDGEQEIIEEYNEAEEKIWREEHRKRVREEKQKDRKEKQNKESTDKSYEDLMKKLADLEIRDELESELEELGVQDDEMLKKLLAGEIQVQEKKRISHYKENQNENLYDNNESSTVTSNSSNEIYNNVSNFTNNNTIPNTNDFNNSIDNDSDLSESSSNSDIPEEVLQIEKEIENLTTREKIKFIKKKIKQNEKFINSMRIKCPADLDIKLTKVEVHNYLLDYVILLEDEINESVECNKNYSIDTEKKLNNEVTEKKKRRISFALQDDIKYIDSNEKVENMFKEKKDIITLDPAFGLTSTSERSEKMSIELPVEKKLSVIEKVEKSLEFVKEMQSQNDFDLVGKILNSEKNVSKTLSIKFKHSKNIFKNEQKHSSEIDENNETTIGSPADFYEMFSEQFPQNVTKLEPEVPAVENKNDEAYKDLKLEFCLPKEQTKVPILKNKEAVTLEVHNTTKTNKKNKKKKKVNDELDESGFHMIMGDVIENPITEPEPLPIENYIDSHAPKKRISRFKEKRSQI